jgi:uncharacterized membrane protein
MTTIERHIDVGVPIRTAYNQWTQFEEFPLFIGGIESVAQMRDDRLRWRASVGGPVLEWDAVIDEQEPDKRIVWHSIRGVEHRGAVAFIPISEWETRVVLRVEYERAGLSATLADALGVVERRVEESLRQFKAFIERRGSETGAWRGAIRGGRVRQRA